MTSDNHSDQRPDAAGSAPDHPIARWAVAVIAVVYGFAKLNGSQFTVLDSELDKPMGSVSGFWLTWYYFSYSAVYGNLVAAVQILGGLLVTQPRLALAGVLVLLPVAANIVLIDIFYGVDVGGTGAALVFLALLVRLVAPHVGRLRAAVIPDGPAPRPSGAAIVAPLALILAAFAFTYWTANYNNRAPTAVDGVWDVERTRGTGDWVRVFFEHNRAHKVVMKDASGRYHEHHFELEPDGRLRIWMTWLSKGPLLFEGEFTAADRVRLRRADGTGDEVLNLIRRGP